MKKYTTQELENLAFHDLPIKKVIEYANPLKGCWPELKSPITIKEVRDCIKNNQQELVETPSWIVIALNEKKYPEQLVRENHIKKIAFFVVNEVKEPIHIDVGIPSLGGHVDYIIDDGNHRLAAEMIKVSKTIKAKVSGEVSHAQSLGLWYPNEFETLLQKRYEEEYAERSKENSKNKIKKPKL